MDRLKRFYNSLLQHPVRTLILLLPYIALAGLNLVNPYLREGTDATYCPTPPPPTVLEGSLWSFPSPVLHWLGYLIFFLIVYLVIFLIIRMVKNARLHQAEALVNAPNPFRIVAPFYWIMLALFIASVIASVLAAMYPPDYYYRLDTIFSFLIQGLNNLFTPLSLLVCIIMFIIGAYQYFITGLDGNSLKRREGRIRMTFSFMTVIVIIIFWGIINLLTSSIGLEGESLNYAPRLDGSGGGGLAGGSVNSKSDTIGFSVGGAKDADNFRENIEQCYLPKPSDITYEGLYYDYIFETRNTTGCTALFCPQYEGAVLPDPFSQQDEYFLSVGLGSNIASDTFSRVPLDLVVVLDISGSMRSPFDRYYYDQFKDPNQKADETADWNTSKMEVAKKALGAMIERLQPDDRFGLVVFDDTAETQLEPFVMGQNGYAKAKNAIFALEPRGGTNMEAGLEEGTDLLNRLPQEAGVDRERRIVFLTDAMPNTGAIEQNDLYVIGKRNAGWGIHTTFIGVGIDFNTELVEALTKQIKGANYYSIHSSTDFEKRLDIEFEYMVSPLLFDLTLQIEGGDYEIRTVYGSPEANNATGEVLKVSTLFPSPSSAGNSRGGVILAHLKKVRNTGTPTLIKASYVDRAGQQFVEEGALDWSTITRESASPNVRKAVLLARYTSLIQNWLLDENTRLGRYEKTIHQPVFTYDFYRGGMVVPAERFPNGEALSALYELNYWERLSRTLVVSEDYKQLFKDFRVYMEKELEVVSESDKLKGEVQLLKNLENSPTSDYKPEDNSKEKDITRQRE